MTERSVSRRRFLGAVAGGAALGVAGAGSVGAAVRETGPDATATRAAVPFDGEHQAGIVTAAQDRLQFAAFDVATTNRAELRDLVRSWTTAARALTAGGPVGPRGAVDGALDAPPDDTGETLDLPAAGLTLTFGVGPSLFDDRFGLAARRPAALADLPHFRSDDLDPARSGGDLCVQACAYDEQVAMHAVRNLARIGAGAVALRYVQLGHVRTSGVQAAGVTPRNLMGFKDGTSNLDRRDPDRMAREVWVAAADGPGWMVGGSYLVTRRIRMTIEVWDRTSLREQENILGRTKRDGAALGALDERDAPDFAAMGGDGAPVIPPDAHVRLAHPDQNGGARLLRRGYNFMDGVDRAGHLDAGLFFMAYQRDPRRQFVPVQRRLAASDRLNEYIRHVGSGLWACPGGTRTVQAWGDTLLA